LSNVSFRSSFRLLAIAGVIGCTSRPESCTPRAEDPARPPASAVAQITKVLTELPPPDATPIDGQWVALVRAESWDDASRALEALPEATKKEPLYRLVRARVAMARGEFAQARDLLADLESAFALLADDVERWRADAMLAAGPYEGAARYFAKQSGPKSLLKAASAFDKAGLAAEARAAADRAIAAGGGSEEASLRALRARLADAQGEREVADDDARWIVLHAPAGEEAASVSTVFERLAPARQFTGKERLARADRLAEAGRIDDALAELERAAAASSPPGKDELDWAKAFILYKAKNHYEKAALLFDRLGSRAGTRQAEALFYAARARSRADRDDEAISQYESVVRRFPSSSWADDASYLAARLLLMHARWSEAGQRYKAYLKKFPNGPQKDAANYEYAVALLAGGQHKQARAELHRVAGAISSPSEGARLRELEGVAAAREGDREGAAKIWASVIESQPLSWAALTARARLVAEGGPPPPVIDAPDGRAAEPLSLKLPPAAELFHRLGLEADAESYLRTHEREAVLDYKGREKEALCGMYDEVGRGARRYRIGADAVPATVLSRAPSPASLWAWNCLYPRPYPDRVAAAEQKEALPKGLVYAVMRQESAYDPEAVSSARAVGLLQLMPETARRIAAESGSPFDEKLLKTPSVNIELGSKYLAKMLRTFDGSIPLAVAAYNAGPRAVEKWLTRVHGMELDVWAALIPFEETRTYVSRVMANLARYAFLEGSEAAVPTVDLAPPRSGKLEASAY
jgi:soluble lytic murein transglycosylase